MTFHLVDGSKILARSTFKDISEDLPSDEFIQTHRSYIVSLAKIQKVERHQVTAGGKQIPVTNAFKENLNKALGWGNFLLKKNINDLGKISQCSNTKKSK